MKHVKLEVKTEEPVQPPAAPPPAYPIGGRPVQPPAAPPPACPIGMRPVRPPVGTRPAAAFPPPHPAAQPDAAPSAYRLIMDPWEQHATPWGVWEVPPTVQPPPPQKPIGARPNQVAKSLQTQSEQPLPPPPPVPPPPPPHNGQPFTKGPGPRRPTGRAGERHNWETARFTAKQRGQAALAKFMAQWPRPTCRYEDEQFKNSFSYH